MKSQYTPQTHCPYCGGELAGTHTIIIGYNTMNGCVYAHEGAPKCQKRINRNIIQGRRSTRSTELFDAPLIDEVEPSP